MAEVVLSDALVNALSKEIDVSIYSANELAVDLGLSFADASAAEEQARLTQNPQGKYVHLLKEFVDTHRRGTKAAQDLIKIFKDKKKMFLVDILEEAIKKQNGLKQSGLAKGQRQTETGASARNKSFWKFVAVLSLVVALLAFVAACNNLIPEPGKCASSPCRNGGICHELHGAYSCTCRAGYGGSNCETEYIAGTLSLEELQDTLRRHYEKNIFKIPIKPWDRYEDVDLKKYYTTVSLYKEDKNKIPNKPLQKSILNGSVNDIFRTKVHESLPERIVLFGEAGRGKTTAVAKMAYDWANKNEDSPLKNVKLLFVFKMRNMNAKTGITEAIVPLLGRKYEKYIKELEEYIDSHEKDIFMLFDGYDEFSGKLNCRDNISYVIDILCEKRCRQCRVLVTSRPVRKKDFYSRSFYYSKMVIEGYSQQHATDFIGKFFLPNETKATELKKYLEEDIVTNEMIATPLFCTMVCYLWKDGYFHGKFTRTKLFYNIMDLLRKHLNAKHEQDKGIELDLLNSTLVSVGQVAFKKWNGTKGTNPLVFSEDDFSEVHDDTLNISYSLGLLTKNIKTDIDIIIHIEFFHRLAQEYSAGRFLASRLDEGKISPTGNVFFDMKEIFKFASGTSVLACRKVLASLIEDYRLTYFEVDRLYHDIILEFISEGGTCAQDSETYLTRFLEDGKLQLKQATASNVVGFEKLPGSVKKKITSITIEEMNSSPGLFARLWNSMRTCIHLTHVEMFWNVQPTISPQMKPLYSANSFTLTLLKLADDYAEIMVILRMIPNLRELIIECIAFRYVPDVASMPVYFGKLWDQLDTSSFLSRLVLPIPADIRFNLKHLASIRVFESDYVKSVSSLAHVLTFLPKIRELIIQEIEPVELNENTKAFCKMWENLHTSPHLNRLLLPIPAYRHILCGLKPLRSVQILETKLFSVNFPIVLSCLPNLQKLILHSDIPVCPEFDIMIESAHCLICRFWNELHNLRELRHLEMNVPHSVPALHLEPLRSVQTFKTKIKSDMEVIPILLSWLPNISELEIIATNYDYDEEIAESHDYTMLKNGYDRNIAEDTYYDKVVSAITHGLVKNGVQLKVLNMTFHPRREANKTVSRDTVENLIQMLKSSTMRQLEIVSFNYCVFNESDLIEIITAIREFTSIMFLRIDCSLDSKGELSRFAIQRYQTPEEKQEINRSKQSGSLMLTLIYRGPLVFEPIGGYLGQIFPQLRDSRTEENFVLPR